MEIVLAITAGIGLAFGAGYAIGTKRGQEACGYTWSWQAFLETIPRWWRGTDS